MNSSSTTKGDKDSAWNQQCLTSLDDYLRKSDQSDFGNMGMLSSGVASFFAKEEQMFK